MQVDGELRANDKVYINPGQLHDDIIMLAGNSVTNYNLTDINKTVIKVSPGTATGNGLIMQLNRTTNTNGRIIYIVNVNEANATNITIRTLKSNATFYQDFIIKPGEMRAFMSVAYNGTGGCTWYGMGN